MPILDLHDYSNGEAGMGLFHSVQEIIRLRKQYANDFFRK